MMIGPEFGENVFTLCALGVGPVDVWFNQSNDVGMKIGI